MDGSTFAVLALSKRTGSADATLQSAEGMILLFNAEKAVPLSAWFVSKVSIPSHLIYCVCTSYFFTNFLGLVGSFYVYSL